MNHRAAGDVNCTPAARGASRIDDTTMVDNATRGATFDKLVPPKIRPNMTCCRRDMARWRKWLHLAACAWLLGLCAGCAGARTLPQPPSDDGQRDVTLNPYEAERRLQTAKLHARAALIQLYEHLHHGRHLDAARHLSDATRSRITDDGSLEGVAEAIRPDGATDGDPHRLDPVDFLLAERLARIDDAEESGGRGAPADSLHRQTLLTVDEDGRRTRVIMIREKDRWVLHRTITPTTSATRTSR